MLKIAALLGALALFTGCSQASESTRTSSELELRSPSHRHSASPSMDLATSRAQDLDELIRAYHEIHPKPFHAVSRRTVMKAIASMKARAADLSDEQFFFDLMRLTALLGKERDGHMGFEFGEGDDPISPLWLHRFSDGIFVVDAQAPHRGLIGERVLAVGNRPWQYVWRRLVEITPRDNPMTLMTRIPNMLLMPRLLRGVGLSEQEAGTLTLQTSHGHTHEVSIAPITVDEYSEVFKVWHPVSPGVPPHDEMLAMRTRGRDLWVGHLPRERAIYVGYNGSGPTSEAAEELLRMVRREDEERVIVDMRNNGGGNNALDGPLLGALENDSINQPGKLFVLAGRSTFSAAMDFLMELRSSTSMILVGESPGGAPSYFADTEPVFLPNSRLTAYVAGIHWNSGNIDIDDYPGALVPPDVVAIPNSRDHFGGHDVALETALNY